MDVRLHNTLGNKTEKFEPWETGIAHMYHCGPTVYGPQHIGNLSMFVFTDVLRRTLEYAGYEVKQVINFTDFGHLSGDNLGNADQGEDRMTKGLLREGLPLTLENMRQLAEKYAQTFLQDLANLNVKTQDTLFPYASDYIPEQIKMIETLESKGFAYRGEKGVYFDTSKFPNYGELGNIDLAGLNEGARVEKTEKKNPTDFVLWKSDGSLGWPSPWGLGFPGWHIECSAMIVKLLGEQIDIHTGGVEHIGVHHNNEIAQAESATGKKPFSKFWLHRAHLRVDGAKIAKSSGTAIYLSDFKTHGLHPLSFRYWLLSAHYRTPANFTWESVLGAQSAFEKIINSYNNLPDTNLTDSEFLKKFEAALGDDLNTPLALPLLREAASKKVLNTMSDILGLNIASLADKLEKDLPEEILDLKKERDLARSAKNWARSDELRLEIERQGFTLEDTATVSCLRRQLAFLS